MVYAKRKSKARTGRKAAGAGLTVRASRGRFLHWASSPSGLALLLGLLTLAIRIAYLLESAGNPFRHHLDLDPRNYHIWAQTILSGTPFGPEPFLQAPLYPYFLAACYAILGTDPTGPLWIQAVLAAATTFIGARIAGHYWGKTALVATGLFLALYRPAIFYTGVLLVPVLAAFLLACALLLAQRRPLLSGIFIGLTGLAHPTMLPGGFLAILGFMMPQRVSPSARLPQEASATRLSLPGRRQALLAALGVVLAIAPATVHNLVMSGRFVPISANAGINLYIGNGPEANGFYSSPFGMRGEEDPLGIHEAARLAGRPLPAVDASRFWTTRTLNAIREQPRRALLLYLQKLYVALSSYETPQIESLDFEKRYGAILRLPFLPGWLLLLSLTAFTVVLRRREALPWVLAASVLMTAFVIAVFFVTARFRMPAYLLLALAAGAGISALLARMQRGQVLSRRQPGSKAPAAGVPAFLAGRWILPALAAGAGVALLFGPNWLAIGKTATFGQYHYRLGTIAEREGRPADAMEEYAAALRIDPNVARAAINLGIMTARNGDLDAAARLLERGVALDPRSARGFLALGQIRQIRGDLASACSLYANAWAADTTFLTGLEFLATARYLQGHEAAAEALAADLIRRAGAGSSTSLRCAFILGRMRERRRYGWPVWGSRERAMGDLALAVSNLSQAEELYQRALDFDTSDLAALLELARIAARRGDSPAATSWTQAFLERGGPPEAVRDLTGGPARTKP